MLNDFKRRHIHMKHIFSLLSLLCITLFTASCASDNDDFGHHAPEPKPRPCDDGMQMSLFDD